MKHAPTLSKLSALILPAMIFASSVACQAPKPTVELPKPYDRNGVRVFLKELYGPEGSVLGISGEAVNIGKETLKTCTLQFDVLNFAEYKVAEAAAFRQDFAPGEHWQFQAQFSMPYSEEFDSVHMGPVTVTK